MPPDRPPPPLPTKWRFLFHGFRWYVPRVLRKTFTAVRLDATSSPWPADGSPVLVVTNHPGWNDPLVLCLLSFALDTDEQYAAIEAAMLAEHAVFGKIGFVGVDTATVRGAGEFLRTAGAILSRPGHVLWVTAQGRFADPRERPLGLRSGVGHVAKSMPIGWVVPVAIEYPFWDAPKPEALVHVGDALPTGGDAGESGRQWTARIEAALTGAADALAAAAVTRDPGRFVTLLDRHSAGRAQSDILSRMAASARGRTFRPPTPALPGVPPRTNPK